MLFNIFFGPCLLSLRVIRDERLLVASKLPAPPDAIKKVHYVRNDLFWPYQISVFGLLQGIESQKVFSKQATIVLKLERAALQQQDNLGDNAQMGSW